MIRVEDMSFAYPGSPALFEGLSMDFHPGRSYALTGPSGRGKSTLLYILGLLMRPTTGRVRFSQWETSALSDAQLSWLRATHIGFVFQDASLDPSRTVLDNVLETTLYADAHPTTSTERAKALLRHFDVAVRWDRRPGQISGGQAQRVALCRALLGRPQLVLADEPTGNLDRDSADVVLKALREAATDGATVVIVTHDARVADAVDEHVSL